MFRSLSSILLVVLMLASTVGILVYTHVCHGKAEQWSSAIVPVKKCCSTEQHRGTAPEDGRVSIAARPCCEDHTAVAALGADFLLHVVGVVHQLSTAMPALPALPAFAISALERPVSTAKKGYAAHAPPPLPWGRNLLIYKQVFRL
jgi:hypothetical protein